MGDISVKSNQSEEMIDITDDIQKFVADSGVKEGFCFVYTPHTTAAITINENADPDVKRDILYGLREIVPKTGYNHSEGNSDAHIKSSIIGCSEMLIIDQGKLKLGAWQGIIFCEFDGPRQRKVYVKVI